MVYSGIRHVLHILLQPSVNVRFVRCELVAGSAQVF